MMLKRSIKLKKIVLIGLLITITMPVSVEAQVSLGKMTAFWRTGMMTGGRDQETPWHLYKNPVAYLDVTDFPYNYEKYGHTADDDFVLHADSVSFVRFLSGPGTTDQFDLAKRINGKVVLQKDVLANRFKKVEASGAIKKYLIVLDNIPLCFPTTPIFETYGQVALPANMNEWKIFIVDLCEEIKNILGEEKANNLDFRMGTEAHNGNRFKYTQPEIMLYFYKITAEAVKSVLPGAKFGPYNTHTPWRDNTQVVKFDDLVRYCNTNNLPLDFIGYTWYIQGENPVTEPSGFHQHWKSAFLTNPDLEGIPIEYQEFGSLGMNGNLNMRPSSDNAAAMFNMLMESVAGGFTSTYHWPVDVNISKRINSYVLNGLGWMFQVLDHTTGGDAYLLQNEVTSSSGYGSQIKTLGVFGCDNNKNYLIISSFNPDISKDSYQSLSIEIPKECITLNSTNSILRSATLDRNTCPLLAIRKDIERAGFLAQEYVAKPNITTYFPVHYHVEKQSVTDFARANDVIVANADKYKNLCKNSLVLKNRSSNISETNEAYILDIPVKANSISAILLDKYTSLVKPAVSKSLHQISIHLNSTQETLFVIDNQALNSAELEYSVFNLQGKQFKKGILTQNSVDVSTLTSGFYLFNISNESGYSRTMKFIKK